MRGFPGDRRILKNAASIRSRSRGQFSPGRRRRTARISLCMLRIASLCEMKTSWSVCSGLRSTPRGAIRVISNLICPVCARMVASIRMLPPGLLGLSRRAGGKPNETSPVSRLGSGLSFKSSPWMRGAPQVGLAWCISQMSSRTSSVIGGPKRDAPSRALALKDEELMAQSEHLGLECGPPAEHGSERCENGEKSRDHRRGSLGQIQEILNNDGPDEIFGRDSGEKAQPFRGVPITRAHRFGRARN